MIFFLASHQAKTATKTFAAGVTGEYHIDSVILHSFDNGIAVDSSWRHMNSSKCPVTFITTLNDSFRMIPGRLEWEIRAIVA
jgi:hypothetical protein